MSENLDLVRSIYADWERGDLSASQWAHPDIEYVAYGAAEVGPERFMGPEGMAEGVRLFLSSWEGWTVFAEEIRELDGEQVLVLNRYRARAKRSGLSAGQLGAEGAHIFLVRQGKVARLTVYPRRADALVDLGLEK